MSFSMFSTSVSIELFTMLFPNNLQEYFGNYWASTSVPLFIRLVYSTLYYSFSIEFGSGNWVCRFISTIPWTILQFQRVWLGGLTYCLLLKYHLKCFGKLILWHNDQRRLASSKNSASYLYWNPMNSRWCFNAGLFVLFITSSPSLFL